MRRRLNPFAQDRYNKNMALLDLPEESRGPFHCVMCNRPLPEREFLNDWVCLTCVIEKDHKGEKIERKKWMEKWLGVREPTREDQP